MLRRSLLLRLSFLVVVYFCAFMDTELKFSYLQQPHQIGEVNGIEMHGLVCSIVLTVAGKIYL
jgi:hypothetical protein